MPTVMDCCFGLFLSASSAWHRQQLTSTGVKRTLLVRSSVRLDFNSSISSYVTGAGLSFMVFAVVQCKVLKFNSSSYLSYKYIFRVKLLFYSQKNKYTLWPLLESPVHCNFFTANLNMQQEKNNTNQKMTKQTKIL